MNYCNPTDKKFMRGSTEPCVSPASSKSMHIWQGHTIITKFKKKNFNQKTKSSFRSKYGKIENYFSKLLLWMSSFDYKEASDQVL